MNHQSEVNANEIPENPPIESPPPYEPMEPILPNTPEPEPSDTPEPNPSDAPEPNTD